MRSIFNDFTDLVKDGKPLDLMATWRKTFDKASQNEKTIFQKMYCDTWCEWNTPQLSLTAEGVIGKYHIRFMATLLGDESPTPLRRSDGFDTWTKEIPRVGHKFPMTAKEYRKMMEVYENPHISDTAKVKAIEKTLHASMEDAYLGVKDVMDFILLQAFSNDGVAQFEPEVNNPGGRKFEIDYCMDEENKLISVYNWTDENVKAGKVSPILTLAAICSSLRNRGIEPGEILMSQDLYYWLRMNPATRLLVHGSDKKDQTVTKSELETELTENEIPNITVVKRRMGIDKDGKRKTLDPWDHNFICIKPEGKVAEIQPAIEDNQLMEEKDVDYINAGNGIRIAKWRTGESTGQTAAEYTQGSGRLLPLITRIGEIVCVQVRGFKEQTIEGANLDTKSFVTRSEYGTIETL